VNAFVFLLFFDPFGPSADDHLIDLWMIQHWSSLGGPFDGQVDGTNTFIILNLLKKYFYHQNGGPNGWSNG
jgi:hypothetical protein